VERLAAELKSLRGKTLVLTHSLADLDACASALVLAEAVGGEAACPDKPSSAARHCLEKLGYSIPVYGGAKCENLVLVDVSNAGLLGGFNLKPFGKIIVIDHHYHNKHLKCDYSFIDAKRSSCSEIILEACNALGFRLSDSQRKLLLAGVLHDSAFFKSANCRTLAAAAELCEGIDFREVVRAAEVRKDPSEVAAVQKAVCSASIEEIGGFKAAFTESGAFELQSASTLVEIGCDYAFVLDAKHGKMSAVKREAAPGNVGKMMEKIGKEFGGSGGGHENAGGASGKPEKAGKALETARKELMLLLANNNP